MTREAQRRAARAHRRRPARDHRRGHAASDATAMPQVWALYKEVQDYYEKGMRVPDDVTLLWSRRQLGQHPPPADGRGAQRGRAASASTTTSTTSAGRASTSGSTPIPIAQDLGADAPGLPSTAPTRIWIVNVGDIKPMEFPIQFFLDYAWDPDALARRAPAGVHARVGGARVRRRSTPRRSPTSSRATRSYNGRRKPEMLEPRHVQPRRTTARRRRCVADYNALARAGRGAVRGAARRRTGTRSTSSCCTR